MKIYTAALAAAALTLSACTSGGDSGGPLSAGDWRRDIDFLTSEAQRLHPNLFHSIDRASYLDAARRLKDEVPGLTRAQIFMRLKRLLALPAMREDGHTGMPMFQATGFRLFPLRLYEFDDGVFVIGANPPHESAIGQRVVQIGGIDLAQVNALLDPLITRDNQHTVRFKRTLHYVVPEVLATLGILASAEQGDYLLQDGNGDFSTLLLNPIDKEEFRDTLDNTVTLPERAGVLYLSQREENFRWQNIGNEVVYMKYNLIWHETGAGQSIDAFSSELTSAVAAPAVSKVIVDVRHNGGGNAQTYAPLLDVLGSNAVDQPDRLYVLIDRVTFSAAANFVTEVDLGTAAIFVGEATGGSLNNYGDAVGFDLPHSGFGVSIPTIYWVYAPGDQRLAIEPDLPVPLSSADWFAGRDPVLQAVLNL